MHSRSTLSRFLWIAACCTAACCLGGCSEKVEPQPPTYSQLLTGTEKKAWRLVAIQAVDNGKPPEAFSDFDPCISDNLHVFYANEEKKFEATEGASKCRPDGPDVFVESNWSLVNATATLEFPIPAVTGGAALPFTIKQLTATSLTVEFYFPDVDASYRFLFTAQGGG